MYKRLFFFAVPALLLTLSCQLVTGLGNALRGSGVVVSETRPATGFDRVSVCCGMQLFLTQGSSESLEIEADDNLLPEIESAVIDGKLVVRYKGQLGGTGYRPSSPVKVRVSVINLLGVELSGGGWMEAAPLASAELGLDLSGGSQARVEALEAEQLWIAISGGGELFLQEVRTTRAQVDLSGGARLEMASFAGQELSLESSGGGSIQIKGNVTGQQVRFSGGTQYQAGDLESQTASIRMNGGGRATVWVTEALDVDLSGGAQVSYYGSPTVNQSLSGGSELQSLGEK